MCTAGQALAHSICMNTFGPLFAGWAALSDYGARMALPENYRPLPGLLGDLRRDRSFRESAP